MKSETIMQEPKQKLKLTYIITAIAISCLMVGSSLAIIGLSSDNVSATLFDGHAYSTGLHVDGTSYGDQTNYPMLLTVNKGIGTNVPGTIYLNGHVENWPYDIRFTKADSITELDFWRESYNASAMTVWVELDTIPASPVRTDLYIHYSKVGEGDASNGTKTFDFFDDFSGTALDAQWGEDQSVTVSGGAAHFTIGTNDNSTESYLMSTATFGPNKTFECKATPSADKARMGLSVFRTTFGTGAWNMVGAQFYSNYFWMNINNGSATPYTQQVASPLYVSTDQITSIEWTHENGIWFRNRTAQWIWGYAQVPSGSDMKIYLRDIMDVDWVLLRNHQPIDPTWWEAGSEVWEGFIAKMNFQRSTSNPLMAPSYAWEGMNIGDFPIIEDTTELKMYYSAFGFTEHGGIALATSPKTYPPTSWTKQGLVFSANETPGQWDSGCIRLGNVFKVGSVYYLYYHANSEFIPGPVWYGGSGDNAFGLATSTDGLTWVRNPGNPIFEHGGDESAIEDPVVIRVDSTHWYMYYNYRTGGLTLPGIRMATSSDGVTWSRISVQNVLKTGGVGTWDHEYIEHSQIYYIGGHYVLIYEGFEGWPTGPWSIGIAYSESPTGPFTKYSGNPIFSPSGIAGAFDEFHVATPSLFYHNGIWHLFFQGGNVSASYGDSFWSMGVAYSIGEPSSYLHMGYNLIRAIDNKSINWSYASIVTTMRVTSNQNVVVNLTAWNLMGTISWTADPSGANPIVSFIFSGLLHSQKYMVTRDNVPYVLIMANTLGILNWTYSGPWSERSFSIAPYVESGASPLTADFTYSIQGSQVSFTDASDGTGIYRWYWDFGDEQFSSNQDPSHTYKAPGKYTVTLGVEDSNGNADTVTKVIQIGESPSGFLGFDFGIALVFGLALMVAGILIIVAVRRVSAAIVGAGALILGIAIILSGLGGVSAATLGIFVLLWN